MTKLLKGVIDMKGKTGMTIKFISRYTVDKKVHEDVVAKFEVTYPIYDMEFTGQIVEKLTTIVDKITEHDCECDVEVETNFNRSYL